MYVCIACMYVLIHCVMYQCCCVFVLVCASRCAVRAACLSPCVLLWGVVLGGGYHDPRDPRENLSTYPRVFLQIKTGGCIFGRKIFLKSENVLVWAQLLQNQFQISIYGSLASNSRLITAISSSIISTISSCGISVVLHSHPIII